MVCATLLLSCVVAYSYLESLRATRGEFYALAAMAGCAAFLVLTVPLHVPPIAAAVVGVAVACAARLLSVALGWRTGALWEDEAAPPRR